MMMSDLKTLEKERGKAIKREEELERELKRVRAEINDLEDKITRIKGISKEQKDIEKEAKGFTRDIKKRPRPSYENNFNWEQILYIIGKLEK